jgi:hypothetical protein
MEIKIERCDACGAQAKAVVYVRQGIFYLCGHHTNEHQESIEESGGRVETL